MKLKKSDFYVRIYGRHKGVTGTFFLCSVNYPNKKNIFFLLDCGFFQGNDNFGYIDLNEFIPFDVKRISFVLITHNHIDHIGLLPLLIKQGYDGPIYMTKPGYGLIDIPINEAWKINCKNKINPIYEIQDVDTLFNKMRGISFKKTIYPKKNIGITFFKNGHLVGASSIEIVLSYEGRDDIRLLFSGDYNYKNMFFDMEKIPLNNRSKSYSLVICEATYGNIKSDDQRCKPILVDTITNALENQMKVIIPTFAMGRTQEVEYIIKCMQQHGLIPNDVSIWQGGSSAREITKRFKYSDLGLRKDMRNFLPKNFNFISSKQKDLICSDLLNSKKSSIIISPSGMASYGAIRTFLGNALSQKDVLVLFPGHCTNDSKGYEIINTPKGSNLVYNGEQITLNCDVVVTGEISAHAKQDELLYFLNDMAQPKSILFNHGEDDAKNSIAECAKNMFSPYTKVEVFDPHYSYTVTSEGITEVIQSEFQLF